MGLREMGADLSATYPAGKMAPEMSAYTTHLSAAYPAGKVVRCKQALAVLLSAAYPAGKALKKRRWR